MARGGRVVGNPELLDGPCGPPWDDLELIVFHCYFHCFELLGSTWIFMSVLHKLYENLVFIDIVTPNGLLNSMIFSFFFQIPSYRKNKENINYLFFMNISIVLSSGAPPMHMFFPLKCSKKSIENAPVKTYEIQKTYLKPMK